MDSTVLLEINDHRIRCEVVQTPREHAVGLSKHARLESNEGMLFVFPKVGTKTFWMSSVRFPIDIIGIDKDSRVTRVVTDAMPGSHERWTFPHVAAVLEVPAGTCRKAAIRAGNMCVSALDDKSDARETDDVARLRESGHDAQSRGGGPDDPMGMEDGSDFGGFADRAAAARSMARSADLVVPHDMDELMKFSTMSAERLKLKDVPFEQRLESARAAWMNFGTKEHKWWRVEVRFENARLEGPVWQYGPVVRGEAHLRPDAQKIDIVVFLNDRMVRYKDVEYVATAIARTVQHEIIHVEQFIRSKGMFKPHPKKTYYEQPHEIEAYANAIARDILEMFPNADFRRTETLRMHPQYGRFEEEHGDDPVVMNRLRRLIFEYAEARRKPAPSESPEVVAPTPPTPAQPPTEGGDDDGVQALPANKTADENSPQTRQIREREKYNTTEQYRDRDMPDTQMNDSVFQDEPKEQYFHQLWPDLLADQALEPDISSPVMRVGRLTHTAQIVDEEKFVQKVARILMGKVDSMQWVPDTLNGGATERAVVSRRELAAWLSEGQASEGSMSYILDAASSDRGLRLIGDAFILAGVADIARLGFHGKQPTLVLYRTPETRPFDQG